MTNQNALLRLAELFDDEQLEQVAAILVRCKERAIDRCCDQEVCIGITDKGNPRYIRATDNVKLRKPRNSYKPE